MTCAYGIDAVKAARGGETMKSRKFFQVPSLVPSNDRRRPHRQWPIGRGKILLPVLHFVLASSPGRRKISVITVLHRPKSVVREMPVSEGLLRCPKAMAERAEFAAGDRMLRPVCFHIAYPHGCATKFFGKLSLHLLSTYGLGNLFRLNNVNSLSLPCCKCVAPTGHGKHSDVRSSQTTNGSFAPILLKKSFWGDERKSLEPLMRLTRGD